MKEKNLDQSSPKITHCEFSYQCPETWDGLLETNVPSVRFCTQCDKNVYLSTTTGEALGHASKGECVAIPIELSDESAQRLNQRKLVMGLMRPPPYKKENIEDLYARSVGRAAEFYGIDGCPAGWFYAGIDQNGSYLHGVLKQFSDVKFLTGHATLILVDIPIGLVVAGDTERLCDKAARTLIRPRGSSVFPAPARAALQEHSYQDGSEANFRATGKKMSAQSWAIVPKIREVDDYICSQRNQDKVREMHPEVAFWALNDHKPLHFSKKKPEGANERLDLLMKHYPAAGAFYEEALQTYKRKDIAADDILDALVGAVTASFFPRIATVPESPARDEEGLLMEMVYALV